MYMIFISNFLPLGIVWVVYMYVYIYTHIYIYVYHIFPTRATPTCHISFLISSEATLALCTTYDVAPC